MPAPDVLVVGGGIIGAACARALAVAGAEVEVIDDSRAGAATPASAGLLAPTVEAKREDPLLGIRVRGRDMYAELAPELHDETGIDPGLWTEGILRVAFTEADVAKGKADIAWQRQAGMHTDWVPPPELRDRAPGISTKALGALLAPEDGAIDPPALWKSLLASCEQRAVSTVKGTAKSILIEDSKAVGVRTDSGTRRGGAVLVAAGCWSGRLSGLPRPMSVEPIRGQMISVSWPAEEPPAIVVGPEGYLLKREDNLIAGATFEHAGFNTRVTKDGRSQMLDMASQLYPVLTYAKAQHAWAGLRPGTPDGRPIIGADPEIEGLWYATGHGRSGILLASVTADIVARLYNDQSVEHSLTDVSPARFWLD